MNLIRGKMRFAVYACAGIAIAAALAAVFVPKPCLRAVRNITAGRFSKHTVASRVNEISSSAGLRLGLEKYPSRLRLLAFKREKRLDVFGRCAAGGKWEKIKSYPILAASGGPGPKLREGDRQVPEGVYSFESFNPNSLFHLALRIGYPSKDDLAAAEKEGRPASGLGSDIMLHGQGGSVGCISISDAAIEEIFLLAAHAGLEHAEIIIFPHDPASERLPEQPSPVWMRERYRAMEKILSETR